MTLPALHISVSINRSAADVYGYASNGANLPKWASGLSGGTIEKSGESWIAESPMGKVTITFAPTNTFGVLDHDVMLPTGETFYNPMRVMPNGDGCECMFTLYRQPGVTDEAFNTDAETIRKDLETLKKIIEA